MFVVHQTALIINTFTFIRLGNSSSLLPHAPGASHHHHHHHQEWPWWSSGSPCDSFEIHFELVPFQTAFHATEGNFKVALLKGDIQ